MAAPHRFTWIVTLSIVGFGTLAQAQAQAQTGTPEVPAEPGGPQVEPPPPPAPLPPPPPIAPPAPRAPAPPAARRLPTPPAPPEAPEAPEAPEPGATASADEVPVVRAREGDWGMFFRFGGLSTLTASNNTRDLNGMLVTQVGMRAVLDDAWVVPFSFGSGVRSVNPEGLSDAAVDVGLDLGVGFEYHFRIWRRISPFVGLGLGFGLGDPEGRNNFVLGFGLGPSMGIEYYIADRVSLIAQYLLTFQVEVSPENYTGLSLNTLAGGAATLVFYF
ncbi:MAG: hypothetical protein IT384_20790 [Deltaproteobacteria bacterium]|nr:hypothetical protein [Deltaproteobacteria bacterium]